MNKELMKPIEISIKEKKTSVKATVSRASVYAGTCVIEALTQDNESFYLLYYKNALIYGEKLDMVDEGSFIDNAFLEGILIESPNPLLKAFISNPSVSIPIKNKLFAQLQMHYTPQEIAYLAATLDSFFEKDELEKIIEKNFFHYKRSGNFMKSFQILQIIRNFAPSLKSATDRLYSHELHSYADFYETSSILSILKKDPLYVELLSFHNRSNPEMRLLLEDILRNQNRFVEIVLLWLEKTKQTKKVESIEMITKTALQFITMKEWIFILGAEKINPYRALPEAKLIIEKMIQEGNAETAAVFLLGFLHDLPASYDDILNQLWENLNAGFVVAHLDDFLVMFQQLVREGQHQKLERKMFQLAVILLQEHDLNTVKEKFQNLHPHSMVIQKLIKMAALVEDPDRMMELGDYYAEFKQFDKAIDCFFWEMELQPQNPTPVQKISKMYQCKGMAEEAAAYQKVLTQLKSNQEIG